MTAAWMAGALTDSSRISSMSGRRQSSAVTGHGKAGSSDFQRKATSRDAI
jgi:hypothetical protein